jgi:DNA-binding MarR family transcriptional regulator
VLMRLHDAVRSHGWLCSDLEVSTGAMTNRLDKLEQRDLIKRTPDPADRRGVLLELTAAGRARLEEYISAGAAREREVGERLRAPPNSEPQDLPSLCGVVDADLEMVYLARLAAPRRSWLKQRGSATWDRTFARGGQLMETFEPLL